MLLAVLEGSRGFVSYRRVMSELFFRPDRPGYPHPVFSELEKMVSDWRSMERRQWRPPYQTGKNCTHCKEKSVDYTVE